MSERSYDDLPEAPVRVALSVPLSLPAIAPPPAVTSTPTSPAVPAQLPTSRGRHRAPSASHPKDHGPADTFRVGVLAAGVVFVVLAVFLLVSNAWLR